MAYIYAFSGIVEWNAVSKITTCGTPFIRLWQARMPDMFAGICSGPKGTRLSRSFSTFLSTSTDFVYSSPPCRTRWPTAEISSSDLMTPIFASVKSLNTCSSAAVWSFSSILNSSLSLPRLYEINEPLIPYQKVDISVTNCLHSKLIFSFFLLITLQRCNRCNCHNIFGRAAF